jgi:hypothetical protein
MKVDAYLGKPAISKQRRTAPAIRLKGNKWTG